MALQRTINPTLNGPAVNLGDASVKERHILIQAGSYTTPFFLKVYPSQQFTQVFSLPFRVQVAASSIQILGTVPNVGRDMTLEWNVLSANLVGQAQRPNLSSISRFLDAEYTSIKASNEVVIDPGGGGDFLTWEAWKTAAPASWNRPVCVTFKKGVFHTLPSGPAEGRIYPGDVPGTGKVIITTDGTLPTQSAFSSDLSVKPSTSSRIYPSQIGECAWFETPNSTNHTIFGLRDNDRDIWFRGIYSFQNQAVANSRGFWNSATPSSSAGFMTDVQWDRCMFNGGNINRNLELRKSGAFNGRRIGMFDCYIHNLNAGPQSTAVSNATFGQAVQEWVVWNSHLEAMGASCYVDSGITLPASDMLARDGAIAYCHMYRPLSWHTSPPSDYRPKTFYEPTCGDRLMLYRTLMENGLQSIDGQPGINMKNKYGIGDPTPGSPHALGEGFHSYDLIVQECWMRNHREPTSLAGRGYCARWSIKDLVCEKLGRNATGAGTANYFITVVRGPNDVTGITSPENLYREGIIYADADLNWAHHYSGVSSPMVASVFKNSIVPQSTWGPYSTSLGGDGAVGDKIDSAHDGRGNIFISENPNFFDDVPGMFSSCTFPANEVGLYADASTGDYRISPAHASAGTGVDGYADPGGAANVIAAIGLRGANVRSLEVTP